MSQNFKPRESLYGLFVAVAALVGSISIASATASPDGTTIPSATQIIDNNNNVWTIGNRDKIYENGAWAGWGLGVLLLWYHGAIYTDNANRQWWVWNGYSWLQVSGDPRPATIAATNGRWFGANAVWNTPIPANVAVMSYSSTAIAAYSASVGGYGLNISTNYWTPAFVEAPHGTPTTTVAWSNWRITNVPLTAGVQAAAQYFASKGDTDSKICLYSDDLGVFFDLEYVVYNGNTFSLGAGAVDPATGGGWWDNSLGPWIDASGASLCGGLIQPSEWAANSIPHALAFAWPKWLNLSTGQIYPATTNDGTGTDPTKAIPFGSRLQLDPTLTDAQLTALGVPSAMLMVAHALQTYGGYTMDSNNGIGVFFFQAALGNSETVYPGAAPLPHAILPYLRVVASPAQSSLAPLDNRNTMSSFISSTQ